MPCGPAWIILQGAIFFLTMANDIVNVKTTSTEQARKGREESMESKIKAKIAELKTAEIMAAIRMVIEDERPDINGTPFVDDRLLSRIEQAVKISIYEME